VALNDLFVDPASYDYRIKKIDSEALNNGVTLGSTYNVDRNGATRPQGSGWDMGAYEYVSSEIRRMKDESRNTSLIQLVAQNPIKAGLLFQYLQMKKDIMVYNLMGKMVARKSICQPGIYLVKDKEGEIFQKLVVRE
jgi:hypothetical protein